MKTIYIDSDFKCHVTNDGTMTPVETDFFGEKCDAYVEGFRLVPAGESWTREDGEVFVGEMIAPWRDYSELDDAQRAFERAEMERIKADNADMAEALALLGYEEVSANG